MMMMTSKNIVDIITHEPDLELKTVTIWFTPNDKWDVMGLETFKSADELALFLSDISLTHYIGHVRRSDSRIHTDIDLLIEESTNGRTNIDANVVKAILNYFVKMRDLNGK